MKMRWAAAAALAAAALAVAATVTAGEPACRAQGVCDCESVGAAPILQPGSAWSSLALTAAGAWILIRARRSSGNVALGGVLATTGLAAFAYHATLTGWAARLDELAVTLLLGVLAAHRWQHRLRFPAGAAIGAGVAAAGVAAGTGGVTAAVFVIAALAGHAHRRSRGDLRIAAAAAVILVAGAVAWWAAARPTCRPGLPAHSAWHLAAALAGLLGFAYLQSCEVDGPLYPGAARHERP